MWQANQTIKDDRFLIQEVLGGGGFGIAYRAIDRKSNRQVVIKTLNQRQQNQADFTQQQEKFVNEAMTLKGLTHPHIVKVYELIQADGLWGMVMEYIDGQELAEYVESKVKLTERQALGYIEQVGQALVYIHGEGFLHRDIKPHNIMLRAGSQEAVLIDFGLARGFIDGKTLSMTNSHTPAYAPIEQYDRHGHFGAHTDIYALAATLYHLVTGEAPIFNAKGRLEAQEKGQSIDHFLWDKIPEGITKKTKQGIIKGMSVLPQDRPETMDYFLQLLGMGEQSVPPTATPTPLINYQPVTPPVIPATSSVQPQPKPPLQPQTPLAKAKKPAQQKSPIQPQTFPKPAAKVIKTSLDSATRRNFLKWLGFGGGGVVSVLALSQLGKNLPLDRPSADFNPPKPSPSQIPSPSVAAISPKLTKIISVKLNNKGDVIEKPSGSVKIFTEDLGNGIDLKIVKIPAGKFLMGSPDSEEDRQADESPQHQVNISEFYFGQTLVTQAQWQIIMGNNPANFKQNGKFPVEQVSWLDAVDFCDKLSQKTGKTYRLPLEAEWEYACRAGTTTPFAFGETITPAVVNYDGSFNGDGGNVEGKYRQKTTPVGSFPPNLFGLYDLHGNLWEWCLDALATPDDTMSPDGIPRKDISSRDGEKSKPLRGGSWDDQLSFCRSASRNSYAVSNRLSKFGFRVVCELLRTS